MLELARCVASLGEALGGGKELAEAVVADEDVAAGRRVDDVGSKDLEEGLVGLRGSVHLRGEGRGRGPGSQQTALGKTEGCLNARLLLNPRLPTSRKASKMRLSSSSCASRSGRTILFSGDMPAALSFLVVVGSALLARTEGPCGAGLNRWEVDMVGGCSAVATACGCLYRGLIGVKSGAMVVYAGSRVGRQQSGRVELGLQRTNEGMFEGVEVLWEQSV